MSDAGAKQTDFGREQSGGRKLLNGKKIPESCSSFRDEMTHVHLLLPLVLSDDDDVAMNNNNNDGRFAFHEKKEQEQEQVWAGGWAPGGGGPTSSTAAPSSSSALVFHSGGRGRNVAWLWCSLRSGCQ